MMGHWDQMPWYGMIFGPIMMITVLVTVIVVVLIVGWVGGRWGHCIRIIDRLPKTPQTFCGSASPKVRSTRTSSRSDDAFSVSEPTK